MKGRDILQSLKKGLWNFNFSHIYVEKDAKYHPIAKKILAKFKKSIVVDIDNYKEVFCRGHQNFVMQKNSINLILAIKKENLIYKGAQVCENFGNDNFYYTSSMMNCIYNCEYCYLQGMYPSSNIVIFVNIEDIFKEVEALLKKHEVYLCISYDSDLLAFEKVTFFVAYWIRFLKKHPNLKIELRTKSANFKAIKNIEPLSNMILAWTLSPMSVACKYEIKTPGFNERVKSAKKAIDKGWNVRICFDPVLYIENWKEEYRDLIHKTFNILKANKIYDVSIGVFRVSLDYLKIMRKERPNSIIISYPFKCENGVCSYLEKHTKDLIKFVYNEVSIYMPKEKIYI